MYACMSVHVSLFLWGVTAVVCRNPLARCGLDLQPAQETPDRPSSDLDSGTKGGGKKGCKEERRYGGEGAEDTQKHVIK